MRRLVIWPPRTRSGPAFEVWIGRDRPARCGRLWARGFAVPADVERFLSLGAACVDVFHSYYRRILSLRDNQNLLRALSCMSDQRPLVLLGDGPAAALILAAVAGHIESCRLSGRRALDLDAFDPSVVDRHRSSRNGVGSRSCPDVHQKGGL